MSTRTFVTLTTLLLCVAPIAAAGSSTGSGTGWIYCMIRVLELQEGCEFDNDMKLQSGADEILFAPTSPGTVSLTVSWTAVNADAERLHLSLLGDSRCFEESGTSACFIASSTGPSPLTVSLPVLSAFEGAFSLVMTLASMCTYDWEPTIVGQVGIPSECTPEPIAKVSDQEYSFSWSVS